MLRSHAIRRRGLARAPLGTTLAVCLICSPAMGEEAKSPAVKIPSACTDARHEAKDARQSGHLSELRESLLDCAKKVCGGLARTCAGELATLDATIGLVAPVVTDDTGAPLTEVEVRVDGEPLVYRLDGRPLPIASGVHNFSFRPQGGTAFSRKIMIVQGQRGPLPVSISLTSTPPAPKAVAEEPSPPQEQPLHLAAPAPAVAAGRSGGGGGPSPFAYAAGGLALAAGAGGGLLTYWGNKDNQLLHTTCSPNCEPSSVNHIRTMYVAADVSFGVAAVAALVSAWLFANAGGGEVQLAQHAPPPYSLDLKPSRSGGYASVAGHF